MYASQKQGRLQLLKNALKTTEETNTVAVEVNSELHAQGEKLTNIDQTANKIHLQLIESEDRAKQLTSFWHRLKNQIKRVLGIKKPFRVQEEKEFPFSIEENEGQQILESIRVESSENFPQDEEEQILEEIIQRMRELKNHSKKASNELDRQNILLGKIDNKMQKASNKTEKVNRILKKL